MDQTTEWRPDPYGAHEFRFFSADGKPTLLVRDGERRRTTGPRRPSPHRSRSHHASFASERPPPAPETPSLGPEPPSGPAIRPAFAPPATAVGADHIVAPQSVAYTTEAGTERSSATRVPPKVTVPPISDLAGHRSDFGDEDRSPEALSRPRRIAYGVVFVALALSALGLVYVHLRSTGKGHSTHAAAPTTTTSAPRTTTTTLAPPAALQPSADAAATALVSSWSTGNKAAALTVATPVAVTALFALPYTTGQAIDRGCSTSFYRSCAPLGLPEAHHPAIRFTKSTSPRRPEAGT